MSRKTVAQLEEEIRLLTEQIATLEEQIDPPPGPPPDPPPHLDPVAAAKWLEIIGSPTDVIGVAGLDLLTLYCVTWARWKEAEAKVAELGVVIKSPSGFPIQNPYLSIANRAAADLLKIGKRLGLPAA